ncbi:MAG: hypothetical protein IJ628_01650 [Bacteroidaceae bacterium]|nr:hypothetical protein [Bacteroidaceae bacterium]
MFSYQKNFFNPTQPVDEQVFYQLVRDKRSNALIDGFRQSGDASLKRKLPAFIFQAMFDETTSKKGVLGFWRKQAATRLTGLVVMDIDHVEKPRELYEKWKKLDLKKLGILFIYITPSGKGLKVVFKANVLWGNLIDNQHKMAEILGVEVDESCKDASRMSFVCKEEDILYLNKQLFDYQDDRFAKKYDKEYRNGKSRGSYKSTYPPALTGTPSNLEGEPLKEAQQSSSIVNCQLKKSFKGIPYAAIIDEWWKQQGGLPQEGERNVKLYQLAVNLRAICDNNKQLLLEILPNFGLDAQEMQSIVESATKEQPKGKTKELRAVLEALKGQYNCQLNSVNDSCSMLDVQCSMSNIDQKLLFWGDQIEAQFEHFPILKDICKGLKKNQYPAAVFVGGLFLMTLMTRCTYRFYHRPEELRRLNGSTMIIGDPASGKSFATRLYKLLMAPIFASDKIGREAINAYRELMKTKGANKEKPKKPKAVVRIHPARTSNAQFIQDMVNATETVDGEEMQLHMLTFDTELDNTLSIQKGGSWIDKMSLELKAFHNEEDGQAYSNVDSIMQDFYVTWNFIYTGTPIALKKKVNESNFGSGLATRLTCIPLPSTNFEMMSRERIIDYDSDNRLKDWAFKLDKMKGELSVQKIVDELYDWTARRMADAQENESKADEMLLKRCAYHGLNYSAPFIVMRHWNELHQDGEYICGEFETDDIDWQLTELLVNIHFACQKHYFGAMAEMYFDNKLKEASMNRQRQQKTIEGYSRLPEEFSTEDVMRCFNLSNEGAARSKITRLQKDNLIEKTGMVSENGHSKSRFRKKGSMW